MLTQFKNPLITIGITLASGISAIAISTPLAPLEMLVVTTQLFNQVQQIPLILVVVLVV
jgi:hypothetical protein